MSKLGNYPLKMQSVRCRLHPRAEGPPKAKNPPPSRHLISVDAPAERPQAFQPLADIALASAVLIKPQKRLGRSVTLVQNMPVNQAFVGN